MQARIEKYLEEKLSEAKIAKRTGVTRYQVRLVKDQIKLITGDNSAAVKSPKNAGQQQLEPYRQQIFDWMEKNRFTVFLIHKKLVELEVDVSLSSVQRYIKTCKKKEVYVPVITGPGEEAQVDFGYLGKFQLDGKQVKTWVFCMILSHSRYAFYTIVTEQTVASFIKCHQLAFDFFGGTSSKILIDNLGAGVLQADYYQSEFQQVYKAFADYHGIAIVNARPHRPQQKGKVEAGIKYVKRSFLPTVSTNDFLMLKTALATWNETVCNRRLHGTTRKTPEIIFLKEEKSQLFSLPREKFRVQQLEKRKVDNYGHIYYLYNFYSVPFYYSGEELCIEQDNGLLKIYKDDLLVTTHIVDPRKGQFITFDSHRPYEKQAKTDGYYLEQMKAIGSSAEKVYEILRASKPFHWKNMVKGIISLLQAFSSPKVEVACRLTLERGEVDYKTIRVICIQEFVKKKDETHTGFPKYTNGYYHDLSIYDQLTNAQPKTNLL